MRQTNLTELIVGSYLGTTHSVEPQFNDWELCEKSDPP